MTEGLDEVSDNWRGTVGVISKISLVRPRGLRLVHAYAVRLGDVPAYGDIPGLPSVNDAGGGGGEFRYPAWKHHVNAIGARVRYVPLAPGRATHLRLDLYSAPPVNARVTRHN